MTGVAPLVSSCRPLPWAALALLLAGAGCDRSGGPRALASISFPAPAQPAAAMVSAADYAGSEACRDCHSEQYQAWARSTHGRAGGPPEPSIVLAPFDGTPMRFRDGDVIPRVRGGTYEFVVRQAGQAEAVYSVDGVIGGGHMLGGGSQGFVTEMPDGTVRFLAFDWSRTAETWFCNTGSRLERGWIPITPELSLADCGDWPPRRVIGGLDRFANCQGCHGSQVQAALDPSAAAYRTDYTTLQINCESCHGPAREHVQRATSASVSPDADLAMPSLVGIDKDASLQVCFACHALKDVLRPGWLPGEPLESHFALKFPVLGDAPYLPDGRVRTFAYQEGHLASACYLDGPMDCVSCHEPHGGSYWDTDRRPLASPFDDGQCLTCHASKALDTAAHTFHPPDSDGSRCVSCHMPYLQHPEVGPAVPFARSDHTISIPRPAFDASQGLTGACAQCHADRSAADLEGEMIERWGQIRSHRPAVEGLLVPSAADRGAAATTLLHPGAGDPLGQFQGLARFLVDHLAPDDATVPRETVDLLRGLARDSDLDVRALGLAALHWVSGDDRTVRAELAAALEAPDSSPLRDRWRLALGFLGDLHRDGGNAARAAAAYRKALELDPDDAEVYRALGLLHSQSGDVEAAVAALRRSLELDGERPLTWVNLGVALNAYGDPAGAAAAYQRALGLDAREPLAHFNLGNLRLRSGDLPGAAEAYAAAVAADPGLARGHFNLARTLIQLERYREALPHARRAVEFEPDYDLARQMLSDLERVLGPTG